MGKVLKSAFLGGNDYHITYPHLSVIPEPSSTKCVAFTQYGIAIVDLEIRGLQRWTCLKRTVYLMLHDLERACNLTSVLDEECSFYRFYPATSLCELSKTKLRSLGKYNQPQTLDVSSTLLTPQSLVPHLKQSLKVQVMSQACYRILALHRTDKHLNSPATQCLHTGQHKRETFCSIFKYIEQRSSLIHLCKGWLSPKNHCLPIFINDIDFEIR